MLTDVSNGLSASNLTTDGSDLFFAASNGSLEQIWKTDGTVAGTSVVTNEGAAGPFAVLLSENALIFVNQAPSGTDNTVKLVKTYKSAPPYGFTYDYSFHTADFGFIDPNSEQLQAVEITTLPNGGTLTDNGITVTAGQFIPVADLNGGKLVYQQADGNDKSFTFQVQDNGGTANGGADTDASPKTMTLHVDAAPQLNNVASSVAYAQGETIAVSPGITITDSDDTSLAAATVYFDYSTFVQGDTLAANTAGTTITASFTPSYGSLYLYGVDTIADYQQVLQSVTYSYSGAATTANTPTTVFWNVSDPSYTESASGVATTIACYGLGTLILTDRGERLVEDLVIGDCVITVSGAVKPIRWIGRRSYSGCFAAGNPKVMPICFKRDSLADGVPKRDLWVSPEHAMFLDGALIPSGLLVNGQSIVKATALGEIHYFHVELDQHDVITAEGALSETFVDDESRGMFQNAGDFRIRYPDAKQLPARYCAPRLEDGYALEAVRRRIARRAPPAREAA